MTDDAPHPSQNRPNADMIAVERDYRAGVLSNREIARNYGVTETAVRKWAKARGWTRDLKARVASAIANRAIRETAIAELDQQVRTQSVRSEVRTEPVRSGPLRTSQIKIDPEKPQKPQDPYTDEQIIDAYADAGAAAILQHRHDLNQLRNRRNRLMKHWEAAVGDLEVPTIGQDGQPIAATVLSLEDIATATAILEGVSRVDERIVKIERQALQIDKQQDAEPPPDPEAEAQAREARAAAYRVLDRLAYGMRPDSQIIDITATPATGLAVVGKGGSG